MNVASSSDINMDLQSRRPSTERDVQRIYNTVAQKSMHDIHEPESPDFNMASLSPGSALRGATKYAAAPESERTHTGPIPSARSLAPMQLISPSLPVNRSETKNAGHAVPGRISRVGDRGRISYPWPKA